MLKLYTSVLDKDRLKVWNKLAHFFDIGNLAGGTALALLLNHRKSFDFDIFTQKKLNSQLLIRLADIFGKDQIETAVDSQDELTVFYQKKVKISFVYFPFLPLYPTLSTESLPIFHLNDLFSNKAYVVGRRGAFRDYVDLYWGFQHSLISLKNLIRESQERFKGAFSEKLFLEQLTYVGDITDWAVEWVGKEIKKEEIQKFLSKVAQEYLAI